jgi:hypothetical protein
MLNSKVSIFNKAWGQQIMTPPEKAPNVTPSEVPSRKQELKEILAWWSPPSQ